MFDNPYLLLYWLTRLDDIKDLFEWKWIDFSVISFIVFIVIGFLWFLINYKDDSSYVPQQEREIRKRYNNLLKKRITKRLLTIYIIIISITGVSTFIITFIPTTNEAAFIVVAGKGIDSKTFKAISDIDETFAEFLKKKAKEYLQDQKKQIIPNIESKEKNTTNIPNPKRSSV